MGCWEVVGGGDKGGILVRAGQGTSSEQLGERLSTGAVVEELQLVGERLQYKLLEGTGPSTGWVSISLKDKALLIRKDDTAATTSAAEKATPKAEGWREGDYFVTLGPVFKKAGSDPAAAPIKQLNRKVGSVVHSTGKIWKGPTGGFWVELDVSNGDSGAGEKPGYVMIDGPGFGTPGPCLQKAYKEESPKQMVVDPTSSQPYKEHLGGACLSMGVPGERPISLTTCWCGPAPDPINNLVAPLVLSVFSVQW